MRTDLSQSFILTSEPASTLANWQELLVPTGGVTSFNGRTGSVTPASGDYTPAQVGAEPAITAGTTAQYWRGDKTWSNALLGPLLINYGLNIDIDGEGNPPGVQIASDAANQGVFVRSVGNSNGPVFFLGKTRGTVDAQTDVLVNDFLGQIRFVGLQGAAFQEGARIAVRLGSTLGSGTPTALQLYTGSAASLGVTAR